MRVRSWLLAAVVAGCASSVTGAAPATGAWTRLAIAGRANATPFVAAAGSFVAVAWSAAGGQGTDIYVAASTDEGRTFAPPVRANDEAGSASVSGEQPPRVSVLSGTGGRAPQVVVVWTAKTAGGTRIVTSRSIDGAKTFGPSKVVAGSDGNGNRGWESMAVASDGHVDVVWLDHRELAATAMHHDMSKMPPTHAPESDSVEKAQLSKLYFADLSSATSRVLAAGVCYCCKTSMAAASDGSVYAVWRHVYPGNVRDIAFISSRDGGKTFGPPVRVSDDHWMLDGCPENGPALAISGKTAHVIWPTLVAGGNGAEPTLALFYAATTDGRTFTPRQRVSTDGVPRHPQLATLANGTIAATWDEAAAGGRRVVIATARPAASGAIAFTRTVVDPAAAQYPVVAATPHGYVAAWVSGSAQMSVIRTTSVATASR